MTQQLIDVGNVANDGQGDPLRTAFIKCNDNFTELYNVGGLTGIQNGNSNIVIAEDSVITMSATGVANVLTVSNFGITVEGYTSVVGNVVASYMYGNGRYLTGVVSSAQASLIVGNVLSANVTNSSLNSVGTLGNLSVSGNTVTANATINNTLNVLGETSFGANVAVIRNLAVNGTTTTNSLSVLNAMTVSSLSATGSINSAAISVSGNTNSTNLNVASTVSVGGNVIAGRVNTNTISGTGTTINVTGDLSLLPSGNVNVNNKNINNLATPTQATDATNKAYVDSVVSGLNIHTAANLATTTDLATWTSATVVYDNGTDGVGATLSIVGNTLTALDGVSVPAGARLLVKNQANAVLNGVYDYTSSSLLTRSSDFDDTTGAGAGAFLFVQEGTVNASTGWSQTTPNPVIGNSSIVFTQFSGAGSYSAGTGLSLVGTTFNLADTEVNADTYGTSTTIPRFQVNQQGQITFATTVDVLADASRIFGDTLSANVLNSSLTSVGTLGNLDVANNATVGGNANVTGFVSVTGNVHGLNILSEGVISAVGNVVSGNINTGDLSLSGNVLSSINLSQGNITTPGLISAAGAIYGDSITTTGAASVGGNIDVGGAISSVGNITGAYLYGNGRNVTGVSVTGISNGLASVEAYFIDNSSVVLTANSRTLTLGESGTTPGLYGLTLNADYINAPTSNVVANGITANNVAFGQSLTGGVISVTGSISANQTSGGAMIGTSLSVSGSVTAGGSLVGQNIGGSNLSVSGTVTAATNLAVPEIEHLGANSVGNIGSESSYFDTFYGTAIKALYADLAENYAADRDYAPGTVVSFGGEQEVTISTISGDRRVAGVISTQPAHLMNSVIEAQYPVPVALQGRVPCSVVGTVRKGDMMVSAGNGCARADDNPRPGTVIGKALQNFNGTTGVIEVVVGRL